MAQNTHTKPDTGGGKAGGPLGLLAGQPSLTEEPQPQVPLRDHASEQKVERPGAMVQWAKHLLCKREDLSSNPSSPQNC